MVVDRVAVVVFVRDGRTLLAHRHPGRAWYPDCWDLVGGHIDDGERAEDAVRRECLEELGVRLIEVAPVAMPCTDRSIELHVFWALTWVGAPRNAAPDVHDDLGWFRADELADLTLADRAMLPALIDLLMKG